MRERAIEERVVYGEKAAEGDGLEQMDEINETEWEK